jgi:hypothetical protein
MKVNWLEICKMCGNERWWYITLLILQLPFCGPSKYNNGSSGMRLRFRLDSNIPLLYSKGPHHLVMLYNSEPI